MAAPTSNAQTQEVVPSAQALTHSARIGIQQDKPIMLDYYVDTTNGSAYMGEDTETKEKMLIKSKEEFTSLIQKIYKVQEDFIILTENSIYIVSGKVQKRRIDAKALRENLDD
jgi:hypothetical protein